MWKDEDPSTPELIKGYLADFKQNIDNNRQYQLSEAEKLKIQEALAATEKFCLGLLANRKNVLYMHDLVLMAIGFYGGHLTAADRYQAKP